MVPEIPPADSDSLGGEVNLGRYFQPLVPNMRTASTTWTCEKAGQAHGHVLRFRQKHDAAKCRSQPASKAGLQELLANVQTETHRFISTWRGSPAVLQLENGFRLLELGKDLPGELQETPGVLIRMDG